MKNNKKEKRPSILNYLAKHKVAISFYIFLTIIAGLCDVFYAIIIAEVVDLITVQEFVKAIIE